MNIFIATFAFVSVILGILGLAFLIAIWVTWWLHPLWALLIVPLGLPPITFWHFLALNMFVHAVKPTHYSDKQDPVGAKERLAGRVTTVLLWPVITYYLVLWYMS